MKKGIVAYDISVTKYRTYLSDILKVYGERIQYSVFEFEISGLEFKEMVDRIKAFYSDYETYLAIENLEDDGKSIRIYLTCESCDSKKVVLGSNIIYSDRDIIIV